MVGFKNKKLDNKILSSLGYRLMLLKINIGENFYLFSGSQNDFMPNTKFVVKCAANILKIGWQKKKNTQTYFWIGNFVWENSKKK